MTFRTGPAPTPRAALTPATRAALIPATRAALTPATRAAFTPAPSAVPAHRGRNARFPGPRRVGRPDLALLLGRNAHEPAVLEICAEYGVTPRPGRRCTARDTGVALTTDAHGLVTTITLHFEPGLFTPYHGSLPAGAGAVPRRAPLWSALGHPHETDPDEPWDRWHLRNLSLTTWYAPNADHARSLTLSLPTPLPRAA